MSREDRRRVFQSGALEMYSCLRFIFFAQQTPTNRRQRSQFQMVADPTMCLLCVCLNFHNPEIACDLTSHSTGKNMRIRNCKGLSRRQIVSGLMASPFVLFPYQSAN
jgi:hypothetical protein